MLFLQRTAGNQAVSKWLATGVAQVQRVVETKRIDDTVYYYSSHEKELVKQGLRDATTLYKTREAAEAADREWEAQASKNKVPPPLPPRPTPKEQTPPPLPPRPTLKVQTPPPRIVPTQQRKPLPPVPGQQSKPRTQDLGSSGGGNLAGLVMDLYSLNVDELHKKWTPRLRPPFEEWLRSNTGDNAIDYVKWLMRKGEIKEDPPQEYDGAERTLTPELLLGLDKTVYAEAIKNLESTKGTSIQNIVNSYQDYNKGTQGFWYNVFQWSASKSPEGPADRTAAEFDNWPYSRNTHRPSEVTSRVYLNTTEVHTETVAEDLAKLLNVDECVAIKYAPGKAAAFRRDAIVIYVKGSGERIISEIRTYQKQHPSWFVDETVRLTAPTGLTGVGTAEHPSGSESYSDLTSQAVRKALEQAKDVSQLPALLRKELINAGLDPDHPGRLLH